MNPTDLENYISRTTDRVIKLESELTDIQASLGILLANTKELSNKMITQKNPQEELLSQRVLALEKSNPKDISNQYKLLEVRVKALETPVIKKNWWQK